MIKIIPDSPRDKSVAEQCEVLIKHVFSECWKNKTLYGVFGLDSEMPNWVKDGRYD